MRSVGKCRCVNHSLTNEKRQRVRLTAGLSRAYEVSGARARGNHGRLWRQMVEGRNPCSSVPIPRPAIKKVDDANVDIQALAKAIGRTPGAVALKN